MKLKLIEKELMEKFYKFSNKKHLTNNSIVNYFSGNNSLIIEFMEQNEENNSLLIINPLESNNNKSLIISLTVKNEDKKTVYEELLSQRYNLPIYNKNKIIEFKKLLNRENLSSFYEMLKKSDVKNNKDKKKENNKLE